MPPGSAHLCQALAQAGVAAETGIIPPIGRPHAPAGDDKTAVPMQSTAPGGDLDTRHRHGVAITPGDAKPCSGAAMAGAGSRAVRLRPAR